MSFLSLLPFILFYLVCHHFCSDTVMRHELLIVYANVSEFKIIQVMIFAQFCCQRFIHKMAQLPMFILQLLLILLLLSLLAQCVRRVDDILSEFAVPLSSFCECVRARAMNGSHTLLLYLHFGARYTTKT